MATALTQCGTSWGGVEGRLRLSGRHGALAAPPAPGDGAAQGTGAQDTRVHRPPPVLSASCARACGGGGAAAVEWDGSSTWLCPRCGVIIRVCHVKNIHDHMGSRRCDKRVGAKERVRKRASEARKLTKCQGRLVSFFAARPESCRCRGSAPMHEPFWQWRGGRGFFRT